MLSRAGRVDQEGSAPRATERLAATEEGIERGAALLRAGKLVAFPTETVYGLGADGADARAVAAVFTAKGRPRFNPLIAHYPTAEAAFADVRANETARRLAAAFWPGPLTLVLPRHPGCAVDLLAGAGLETLAVRVPGHDLAHALVQAAGRPIVAPSANPSGGVSPTTAAHVLDGLDGRIDAVIEGGACAVGLESTVIDLAGPTPAILRLGGVSAEEIAACIGAVGTAVAASEAPTPRAPGQFLSHYAPGLPLRLNAEVVGEREALLAFGAAPPGAVAVWQLSRSCDLAEAAARLFSGLRHLDALGRQRGLMGIAVMSIPDHGLGAAINDRLRRAAAPRA